ncbi:hypothetical protein SAMN00790413_02282 [Deinococcus hopiensis KR-140]|uniref:Uncharacterized protein n=1 Tax=Deinococcus hopiensis KR-140 TaxID=695939 RepID=A0A1W1VLB8_9DEIO|nr:hypothetical protein SAMN00790413_02282 [Deinococcus hopiensis KR-140]
MLVLAQLWAAVQLLGLIADTEVERVGLLPSFVSDLQESFLRSGGDIHLANLFAPQAYEAHLQGRRYGLPQFPPHHRA